MSLRFVLLGLLSKEPNTGYGLGCLLRGELDHLWDAWLQQIYAELARLEAQGLVDAESIELANRPAKKVYALTQTGCEALDEWLTQPLAPVSRKDDLLVKLYCLERAPNDVMVHHLEERRDQCESRARELRSSLALARRARPAELGETLALEAALCDARAQASWCTRALSRLREAGKEAIRPPGAVA